jgi:hypothetical protein
MNLTGVNLIKRVDTLVINALDYMLRSGEKYNKLSLLDVIKDINKLTLSHTKEIELQATIDKIIRLNPGIYDEIWNINSVTVKKVISIGPLRN